jgi:hypothetical protein
LLEVVVEVVALQVVAALVVIANFQPNLLRLAFHIS